MTPRRSAPAHQRRRILQLIHLRLELCVFLQPLLEVTPELLDDLIPIPVLPDLERVPEDRRTPDIPRPLRRLPSLPVEDKDHVLIPKVLRIVSNPQSHGLTVALNP